MVAKAPRLSSAKRPHNRQLRSFRPRQRIFQLKSGNPSPTSHQIILYYRFWPSVRHRDVVRPSALEFGPSHAAHRYPPRLHNLQALLVLAIKSKIKMQQLSSCSHDPRHSKETSQWLLRVFRNGKRKHHLTGCWLHEHFRAGPFCTEEGPILPGQRHRIHRETQHKVNKVQGSKTQERSLSLPRFGHLARASSKKNLYGGTVKCVHSCRVDATWLREDHQVRSGCGTHTHHGFLGTIAKHKFFFVALP